MTAKWPRPWWHRRCPACGARTVPDTRCTGYRLAPDYAANKYRVRWLSETVRVCLECGEGSE